MSTDTKPTFSASRIAAWLKVKKQTIWGEFQLSKVAVTEEKLINGNLTKLWAFEALPSGLQERLKNAAEKEGFETVEKMLLAEPDHWHSKVPLSECNSAAIAQARLLQSAQARAIELRHNMMLLSQKEWEQIAVDDYCRHIGRATPRHIIDLLYRTIGRAGASADFSRLELYLAERPGRAAVPVKANQAKFEKLIQIIGTFADGHTPKPDEIKLLWLRAFQDFQLRSETEPDIKPQLLKFLWANCPAMSRSEESLRRNFDRKYAAWVRLGCSPESLMDHREEKRGEKRVEYSPEQDAIIDRIAVEECDSKVTPAIRIAARRGEIIDESLAEMVATRSSKTYVRKSFRDRHKHLAALRVIHREGSRAPSKMEPTLELEYDGILSMDCVTGDDLTAPVYFYVPDGCGWYSMTRGQTIVITEFRTNKILSYALHPEPQYNSLVVRTAMVTAFERYGMPRFILREGGQIWRNSHLVNSIRTIGGSPALSDAEVEYRLEVLGLRFKSEIGDLLNDLCSLRIKFREAYKPNAKPVERVFGLVQDRMPGEPGYCGRDERKDCPEVTRKNLELVRSRKALPWEVDPPFYSKEQWFNRQAVIFEEYNREKQEGKRCRHPVTGEALSPNEAFELFKNLEDPVTRFDDTCRFYLSHVRYEVTVKAPTRGNLTCGYVELHGRKFADEQTGQRIGHKLIAHWNPNKPESCTFTDLKLRNPFTVNVLPAVNALHFGDDSKEARRQARSAVQPMITLYRALMDDSKPNYRQNIVSKETVELGTHIRVEEAAQSERASKEKSLAAKIIREARNLGIPAGACRNDTETAEALALMKSAREQEAKEKKADI